MKRIIVGISGATGFAYGVHLLKLLKQNKVETHLVISKAGQQTREYETDLTLADVKALADHYHSYQDISASIASGSFLTDGMIVTPCSVKTLSEIAYGITPNLLSRAADVVLKERRKLVLMIRETPLHTGHLEAMLKASQMGAIIAPPTPALYAKPQCIDDIIHHNLARVLDLFNIHLNSVQRWDGLS